MEERLEITQESLMLAGTSPKYWIIDSGSTKHIICVKEFFTSLQPSDTIISWGTANKTRASGHGDVEIIFSDTGVKATLQNCLYMPEIGINLLSLGQLDIRGFRIIIYNSRITIYNNKEQLITTGENRKNLYFLPISPRTESLYLADEVLWHQRLGHIGAASLRKLPEATQNFEMSQKRKLVPFQCVPCIQAKSTARVSREPATKSTSPGQKIHIDLTGTI